MGGFNIVAEVGAGGSGGNVFNGCLTINDATNGGRLSVCPSSPQIDGSNLVAADAPLQIHGANVSDGRIVLTTGNVAGGPSNDKSSVYISQQRTDSIAFVIQENSSSATTNIFQIRKADGTDLMAMTGGNTALGSGVYQLGIEARIVPDNDNQFDIGLNGPSFFRFRNIYASNSFNLDNGGVVLKNPATISEDNWSGGPLQLAGCPTNNGDIVLSPGSVSGLSRVFITQARSDTLGILFQENSTQSSTNIFQIQDHAGGNLLAMSGGNTALGSGVYQLGIKARISPDTDATFDLGLAHTNRFRNYYASSSFNVEDDGSSGTVQITSYVGTSSSPGSNIAFQTARGSQASPSAVLNGDVLGSMRFFGYGATGFPTTARGLIRAVANENWSDIHQGTDLYFYTTTIATTTQNLCLQLSGSNGLPGGGDNTGSWGSSGVSWQNGWAYNFNAKTAFLPSSDAGANVGGSASNRINHVYAAELDVSASGVVQINISGVTIDASGATLNPFQLNGPNSTDGRIVLRPGAVSGGSVHSNKASVFTQCQRSDQPGIVIVDYLSGSSVSILEIQDNGGTSHFGIQGANGPNPYSVNFDGHLIPFSNNIRDIGISGFGIRDIYFANHATGSGTPLFGTNCPAVTVSAPFTWIKCRDDSGNVLYVPAWK